MKKVAVILVSTLLVLALAACGGSSGGGNAADTSSPEGTYSMTELSMGGIVVRPDGLTVDMATMREMIAAQLGASADDEQIDAMLAAQFGEGLSDDEMAAAILEQAASEYQPYLDVVSQMSMTLEPGGKAVTNMQSLMSGAGDASETEGTWELEGSTVTITFGGSDVEFAWSGNTLTASDSTSGQTITMVFMR